MNDDALTGLHAATAARLAGLLDVDGGLRDLLLRAHHRDAGYRMRRAIDVDGGLRAIVPDTQPQAGESESAAERNPHATLGLVADLLGGRRRWSTVSGTAWNRPWTHSRACSPSPSSARSPLPCSPNWAGRPIPVKCCAGHVPKSAAWLAVVLSTGGWTWRSNGSATSRRRVTRTRSGAWPSDLDRALDRGDARAAGDLARSMAVRLDEIRAQLRDLARERAGHLGDRLRASLERDVDRCPEGNAVLAAAWATALDRARHDFAGADLSGVALGRFTLDGLLWSSATRWPSDTWRGQVRADSAMIGPDLYEIRGRQVHDSNGVRSPAEPLNSPVSKDPRTPYARCAGSPHPFGTGRCFKEEPFGHPFTSKNNLVLTR
nr:hypothetical protein GCM10020092_055880 [Actinoplanes digitatis]